MQVQVFSSSPVVMERRPSTPFIAFSTGFSGTAFGFNWIDGKPHEARQDTMCDGFESGEIHHYIDVEVSLEHVKASL